MISLSKYRLKNSTAAVKLQPKFNPLSSNSAASTSTSKFTVAPFNSTDSSDSDDEFFVKKSTPAIPVVPALPSFNNNIEFSSSTDDDEDNSSSSVVQQQLSNRSKLKKRNSRVLVFSSEDEMSVRNENNEEVENENERKVDEFGSGQVEEVDQGEEDVNVSSSLDSQATEVDNPRSLQVVKVGGCDGGSNNNSNSNNNNGTVTDGPATASYAKRGVRFSESVLEVGSGKGLRDMEADTDVDADPISARRFKVAAAMAQKLLREGSCDDNAEARGDGDEFGREKVKNGGNTNLSYDLVDDDDDVDVPAKVHVRWTDENHVRWSDEDLPAFYKRQREAAARRMKEQEAEKVHGEGEIEDGMEEQESHGVGAGDAGMLGECDGEDVDDLMELDVDVDEELDGDLERDVDEVDEAEDIGGGDDDGFFVPKSRPKLFDLEAATEAIAKQRSEVFNFTSSSFGGSAVAAEGDDGGKKDESEPLNVEASQPWAWDLAERMAPSLYDEDCGKGSIEMKEIEEGDKIEVSAAQNAETENGVNDDMIAVPIATTAATTITTGTSACSGDSDSATTPIIDDYLSKSLQRRVDELVEAQVANSLKRRFDEIEAHVAQEVESVEKRIKVEVNSVAKVAADAARRRPLLWTVASAAVGAVVGIGAVVALI
ncbi:hypothetical protein HDU76_007483 [Blyttiomyces sp. JEL0837]|nr:hypothetical protein HDU76_007483 [Blyttiomyces sp. JEL0837]